LNQICIDNFFHLTRGFLKKSIIDWSIFYYLKQLVKVLKAFNESDLEKFIDCFGLKRFFFHGKSYFCFLSVLMKELYLY